MATMTENTMINLSKIRKRAEQQKMIEAEREMNQIKNKKTPSGGLYTLCAFHKTLRLPLFWLFMATCVPFYSFYVYPMMKLATHLLQLIGVLAEITLGATLIHYMIDPPKLKDFPKTSELFLIGIWAFLLSTLSLYCGFTKIASLAVILVVMMIVYGIIRGSADWMAIRLKP